MISFNIVRQLTLLFQPRHPRPHSNRERCRSHTIHCARAHSFLQHTDFRALHRCDNTHSRTLRTHLTTSHLYMLLLLPLNGNNNNTTTTSNHYNREEEDREVIHSHTRSPETCSCRGLPQSSSSTMINLNSYREYLLSPKLKKQAESYDIICMLMVCLVESRGSSGFEPLNLIILYCVSYLNCLRG